MYPLINKSASRFRKMDLIVLVSPRELTEKLKLSSPESNSMQFTELVFLVIHFHLMYIKILFKIEKYSIM